MIVGAHSIIYSKNPEADRAFLRDVLKLSHVDVGGGWLIFGLPPAEVAVHPGETNGAHEFYLMCKDVKALAKAMAVEAIACGPIEDMGWGVMTRVTLPGGGQIGICEPRHSRPKAMAATNAKRLAGKRAKARGTARPARNKAKSSGSKKNKTKRARR